ncbi:TIGR00153 family protein [Methanosarcina sp. KYL-1]|uniref:TIGR00153 family protein n=1 Tax=Methanosarcina sp. KYL-1 TaxID=2602068 RepID=UPI002101A005|nr:TIGR00153 family protein [Methanosarcina sp. KYL-1]MCQ1535218.1 TIGR00153 family protein [Methanosarcina sp. KYL-1]
MKYRDFIRSLIGLFSKMPPLPFEEHAGKGVLAAWKLKEGVEAYCAGNMELVELKSSEVDLLETEADAIKQEIRKNLPSSLLLPVDSKDLLFFLNQQDEILNKAQSAAYWLTLRPDNLPEDMKRGFLRLATATLETISVNERLLSGFYGFLNKPGGQDNIREILTLVPQVEKLEHEVDLIESELLKKIFANEKTFGGAGICHLTILVDKIGDVADRAAAAADTLRTMLLRR